MPRSHRASAPAAPSSAPVRSNLFLTPELHARIERVAAAFAQTYGEAPGLPQVQRMALTAGLAVLEDRLGIAVPLARDAGDSDTPERHQRTARAKS